MRKSIKIDNIEADLRNDANQLDEPFDDENPGGFLKLTATNEWLLGENTAPINKKMRAKAVADIEKAVIEALDKQYADVLAPLKENMTPKKFGLKYVQKLTKRTTTPYVAPPELVYF